MRQSSMLPKVERRRRQRFPLHCSVRFTREKTTIFGAVVNISSRGFFCVTPEPLTAGEHLRCTVDLTDCTKGANWLGMNLSCDVLVLRSEPLDDGFGSACVIRDYSVGKGAASDREGDTKQRTYYQ